MDRRGFLKTSSLATGFYFLSGIAHQATKGGKAFAITREGATLPLGSWSSHLVNEWTAMPTRIPNGLWKVYSDSVRTQNTQELRSFAFEFRRQATALSKNPSERRTQLRALTDSVSERLGSIADIRKENPQMLQSVSLFMHQALDFDAGIPGVDVFQALRNVVTALFLQEQLGVATSLTPSMTAYSLLYPYTDNYLDDTLKGREKIAFAERFRRRLSGESVTPSGSQETKIFKLVGSIEGEYPRAQHPEVYKALLLIHDRQIQSLARQKQKNLAQFSEAEVLDMTIQKGGASVLADAILVSPSAKESQLQFAYRLGFVLQLIDDLQDATEDYLRGDVTVFTYALARRESLEPLVLKLLQEIENTPVENPLFKKICSYLVAEGAVNLSRLPNYYPGMGSREYEQRMNHLQTEMPRLLRNSFLRDLSARFEMNVARMDDERIEKMFGAEFDKDPRGFANMMQEALD